MKGSLVFCPLLPSDLVSPTTADQHYHQVQESRAWSRATAEPWMALDPCRADPPRMFAPGIKTEGPQHAGVLAQEMLSGHQTLEKVLNNESNLLPRPTASATIRAMTPITMIGKNFRGSSDRI